MSWRFLLGGGVCRVRTRFELGGSGTGWVWQSHANPLLERVQTLAVVIKLLIAAAAAVLVTALGTERPAGDRGSTQAKHRPAGGLTDAAFAAS